MRKNKEISPAVLLRDREVFRKIQKRITFEEKLALLDFRGDYRLYQRNLLKLARRRGIEVWPVK